MYAWRSRFSLDKMVITDLNGAYHKPALLAYLLIVAGHFSEHLVQAVQVFIWGWARGDAVASSAWCSQAPRKTNCCTWLTTPCNSPG